MSLAFVGSTALVVQADTGGSSRLATSVDNNKRTSLPPVPRFWLRPAIVRHDPGLAASPPVRYMLKVEGRSLPFPFFVRCARTSSGIAPGGPKTRESSAVAFASVSDCGAASGLVARRTPRPARARRRSARLRPLRELLLWVRVRRPRRLRCPPLRLPRRPLLRKVPRRPLQPRPPRPRSPTHRARRHHVTRRRLPPLPQRTPQPRQCLLMEPRLHPRQTLLLRLPPPTTAHHPQRKPHRPRPRPRRRPRPPLREPRGPPPAPRQLPHLRRRPNRPPAPPFRCQRIPAAALRWIRLRRPPRRRQPRPHRRLRAPLREPRGRAPAPRQPLHPRPHPNPRRTLRVLPRLPRRTPRLLQQFRPAPPPRRRQVLRRPQPLVLRFPRPCLRRPRRPPWRPRPRRHPQPWQRRRHRCLRPLRSAPWRMSRPRLLRPRPSPACRQGSRDPLGPSARP